MAIPIDRRILALRRFALSISILNILGHSFLGFEQSLAVVFSGLFTAYITEFLLETVDSRVHRRRPLYACGKQALVDFFLPSHITGLGTTMLMYSNDEILPICFAAAIGICSKYIFRNRRGTESRHFMNPSNIGILTTLILFPQVTLAAGSQFTKNLFGLADWGICLVVILVGSLLNGKLTLRMPLIGGWILGFILQAVGRHLVFNQPLLGLLLPVTGFAFLLFTYYMITDPGTTPSKNKPQLAFGLSVGILYGVITMFHVVYGFFFSLLAVCLVRGLYIEWNNRKSARVQFEPEHSPAPGRTQLLLEPATV